MMMIMKMMLMTMVMMMISIIIIVKVFLAIFILSRREWVFDEEIIPRTVSSLQNPALLRMCMSY